ncbi:MAG: hypothetical protein FWC57_03575 [Endomicrobia bacterium]|nr:hypothetical protein [Endomicrobiia bacterium]
MAKFEFAYHRKFGKAAAFKIAAAVLFAMFINIVNLGAFAGAYSLNFNSAALKAESKSGRVCINVNAPVKLFKDLFNSAKSFGNTASKKNGGESFAAVLPKAPKAGQSYFRAAAPFASTSSLKVFQNFSAISTLDFSFNSMRERLCCGDFIRFLLLAMILFSLLPRGVPVRTQKFNNIVMRSPAF